MRLKDFGRIGRKVSEIGMGTYYDPLWIASAYLGWKRGRRRKVEALKAGLEAGMTLLDTAEIYGSEGIVKEAMEGRKRDEVFLATKVWSSHLRWDALVWSFEKSLRRLGTSYIDLYQIHWPNQHVSLKETMGAMEWLIREGKLRHVGVSNFSLSQIKEAQSAMPRSELSSVQLDYSLVRRDVEREVLPYCASQSIALLAYYPLGHGRLPTDGRLEGVARSVGKTKSQVALRWLARREDVFPIPRASRPKHVLENSGASGWDISDEQADEIELKFR